MAVTGLPANPLSIALSFHHKRLWWQVDDEDELPERWDISADVWQVGACPEDRRHVGDISLAIADLRRELNLLDSIEAGEWALEVIAETVIDPAHGLLHEELDEQLSEGGAPRMVILRGIAITPPWRGHGLGNALVAGTLRTLASGARLAVCRVSPLDFASGAPDRVSAELASVRMAGMLERIGFRRWRDVHVIDLRDTRLLDARMELFERWYPTPNG